MKVLVIPDVHLKSWMFEQADRLLEKGAAERAVCLMDIPDDWDQEYRLESYAQAFDAAAAFARKYPETLWAYGNHDLSYLWQEPESGYSIMASRLVREKLEELGKVLPPGNEIRYIQKIDDVLFCHGGVLDEFVRSTVRPSLYHDVDAVVASVNALGHEEMWNDASPIWHRPQYSDSRLYKPRKLLQVVGHTPVDNIYREGNVISCDVFSTYRSGKPIGSREFPVIDTKTWEFWGIWADEKTETQLQKRNLI